MNVAIVVSAVLDKDRANQHRATLGLLLLLGGIGIIGAGLLLYINATSDFPNVWLMSLFGIAILLTSFFVLAAGALRRSLGRGDVKARFIVLLASVLNLLVLGVPIVFGILVSGSFGLAAIGQAGGAPLGLLFVGFAVLGIMFFVVHTTAIGLVWSLRHLGSARA